MKSILLISSISLFLFASTQILGFGADTNVNIQNTEEANPFKTTTVKLKITGMTCAGCSSHVTKTLTSIDGVVRVSLEYPGDVATVEYNPEKTTLKKLVSAIEKINYKATEVKD